MVNKQLREKKKMILFLNEIKNSKKVRTAVYKFLYNQFSEEDRALVPQVHLQHHLCEAVEVDG